ncbi:MAG: zinc dependent phospholipase C family protein [Lachnospiraceae bacterium]|nr:zinc dependent phospholipase C family protein [Lachnospiraceae bacterium]
MRKKSHIALSIYLAAGLHFEELDRYRKAFYLGSVLPDLNPKMLAVPHEFDTSWDKIQALILQIESDAKDGDYNGQAMWVRIGMVLHYLADYFTFPHNTCFTGSLKGHCMHESEMKYLLRAYLCTAQAGAVLHQQRIRAEKISTVQELFAYIENAHQDYMREQKHSVINDCHWIVEMCSCAGIYLTRMVCGEESTGAWLRSCAA